MIAMNDTEAPLRETIAAWLRDQGHQAVVEAQDERCAEVRFRTRGRRFAVRVDEDDPAFLYIIASMELPDDAIDELQARRAAALTESRTKVVQVEILWETRTLVLAAEQLVTEPGGPSIFWRTVSFLEESVYRMRQAFDEEAGRAAASRFTEQLEAELAKDDSAPPASPAATEDAR
jgi:hypothetical protein